MLNLCLIHDYACKRHNLAYSAAHNHKADIKFQQNLLKIFFGKGGKK